MSKSRSTSLEQGELSPDFNDSPHIDLEMVSESELRREKERKRKREEQEQMDEHEDILTIKPPQVRHDEHEHLKKVRRSDDRSEERSKKRSHHESDRLERLERERRRLDNERHRHLDKIQKEREYEREVTRREKSGRTEEGRRRDERRDHRSRPARDTHAVDHRRSRKEPRERAESSPSPYSRRDEKRRDHGRRERIERERKVEEKVKESDDDDDEEEEQVDAESEDETSNKVESQESEVVDDEKVSEDDTKGQEVVEQVNGGTPKYDHLHFARSKFDIEEDDDDDSTQDKSSSNNNNNNKSPTPVNHNQDESPAEEIDEDEKKSDDDDDDADSVNDVNNSKIIDEEEDKEDEPELPSYFPAIQGCRSVEEFHCLNKINEGTYGVVYRAVDLKLREVVALKRLKLEKEKDGFPITSLREIKLLMMARHPNIVTIKEVVVGSNLDKVYMVMEYVEHDLKSLMESMKDPFTIGEVKTLMLQLLRGVEHLHDNWIIHRDLKTSNLLLSHSGVLKIADFGLAREYGSPLKPYTPIVVTLWYRSPELLLQTKKYSVAVDMWSVGCIFAEFLLRRPLFAGKTEIDQLSRIFKVLGSPNEDIWPGVKELPVMQASTFAHHPYNQLRKKFEPCLLSEKGFQLMNNMLTYCPEKRMTADIALGHDYFFETPLPTHTSMFPTWPAKSELYKAMKSPKAPTGGKAISKLNSDNDLTKTSNMPSQGFFFKFC